MHRALALCLGIVLVAAQLCHARDLAIVANKNNTALQITAQELQKLFKAGTQSWPDGKKIKIFLAGIDLSANNVILQRACGMKPEAIKSLLDAHKADIQVVSSDEVVLTMVDSNPGAIGIVNVYSINSRVKVLKLDGKLPMESGYLLHGN